MVIAEFSNKGGVLLIMYTLLEQLFKSEFNYTCDTTPSFQDNQANINLDHIEFRAWLNLKKIHKISWRYTMNLISLSIKLINMKYGIAFISFVLIF